MVETIVVAKKKKIPKNWPAHQETTRDFTGSLNS